MTTTTYNHMSRDKLPIGQVLKGRGVAPLENSFPMVEAILELYQPAECVSRGECMYLVEGTDFSRVGLPYDEGYVHTIEPIGRVEKRDTQWIGILQQRYHPKQERQKDVARGVSDEEIARRYWHGVASDDPIWELVTKEARVVSVDDNISSVRPPSSFARAMPPFE